jgi:C4-dicarboxylate-binding protein DctP
MSKKFWNKLPKNLQENVIQAMNEATQKEREYAEELNTKQFNLIKEYADKTGKLEIINLSTEQRDAWAKVVSKIYPEFYSDKKIGENLIKGALNTK